MSPQGRVMNKKKIKKQRLHSYSLPRASQKTLAAAIRTGMWIRVYERSLEFDVGLEVDLIFCCIRHSISPLR